jgi:hypothetical protein
MQTRKNEGTSLGLCAAGRFYFEDAIVPFDPAFAPQGHPSFSRTRLVEALYKSAANYPPFGLEGSAERDRFE